MATTRCAWWSITQASEHRHCYHFCNCYHPYYIFTVNYSHESSAESWRDTKANTDTASRQRHTQSVFCYHAWEHNPPIQGKCDCHDSNRLSRAVANADEQDDHATTCYSDPFANRAADPNAIAHTATDSNAITYTDAHRRADANAGRVANTHCDGPRDSDPERHLDIQANCTGHTLYAPGAYAKSGSHHHTPCVTYPLSYVACCDAAQYQACWHWLPQRQCGREYRWGSVAGHGSCFLADPVEFCTLHDAILWVDALGGTQAREVGGFNI